jgi:hypothetical protein
LSLSVRVLSLVGAWRVSRERTKSVFWFGFAAHADRRLKLQNLHKSTHTTTHTPPCCFIARGYGVESAFVLLRRSCGQRRALGVRTTLDGVVYVQCGCLPRGLGTAWARAWTRRAGVVIAVSAWACRAGACGQGVGAHRNRIPPKNDESRWRVRAWAGARTGRCACVRTGARVGGCARAVDGVRMYARVCAGCGFACGHALGV